MAFEKFSMKSLNTAFPDVMVWLAILYGLFKYVKPYSKLPVGEKNGKIKPHGTNPFTPRSETKIILDSTSLYRDMKMSCF